MIYLQRFGETLWEKCVRELKSCYVSILQYAENENEAISNLYTVPLYDPHIERCVSDWKFK